MDLRFGFGHEGAEGDSWEKRVYLLLEVGWCGEFGETVGFDSVRISASHP